MWWSKAVLVTTTVVMVTPAAGQRTSINTVRIRLKVTTHQYIAVSLRERETDLPSVALVRRVTLLLCRFNLVTPPQANFFWCVEAAKSPWLFMHWAEHRKTNSLSRNTDEKLCTVFILWWKSIQKSKQEGIFRLKETHRQNSAVIGFHARQMGSWMSVISKSRQSCVILNFWRSEAIKSPKWIKQCIQPWLSDELSANTHTGCVVQTQKCHWLWAGGHFQDLNNSMMGRVASGSCCCFFSDIF